MRTQDSTGLRLVAVLMSAAVTGFSWSQNRRQRGREWQTAKHTSIAMTM